MLVTHFMCASGSSGYLGLYMFGIESNQRHLSHDFLLAFWFLYFIYHAMIVSKYWQERKIIEIGRVMQS